MPNMSSIVALGQGNRSTGQRRRYLYDEFDRTARQ